MPIVPQCGHLRGCDWLRHMFRAVWYSRPLPLISPPSFLMNKVDNYSKPVRVRRRTRDVHSVVPAKNPLLALLQSVCVKIGCSTTEMAREAVHTKIQDKKGGACPC